ncbi:hypothetical protein K431DRAFT_302675 [Polychaeton citri CBS 116435]|uniref:peptidylprolyl isomerase n=1 Tax=Polychaeton citri CBS 116435 TaxID=1314669 RepID=A0A9P4URR3_9PEZI|nr:hypothetical protein K431DRAFT_302675 [Polychaeton citri CBS 116435]
MRSIAILPTQLVVFLASQIALASADVPKVDIKVTTPVSCSRPTKSGDTISVHYRGRLTDGKEFDESYKRGQPFRFHLGAGEVIKGWDQGLLGMCPGEARLLTIPPELGYGSRGAGAAIPPDATLVFETELVDIVGVKQEQLDLTPTPSVSKEGGLLSIATAPPVPPQDEKQPIEAQETVDAIAGSEEDPAESQNGECRLLGPFALLVQAALGGVALLSLVWKRWREKPRRPWKIWFFDASKQVLGSVLLHILNIAMSMFGANDLSDKTAQAVSQAQDQEGRQPNPCSFYLLNLGIDTTIGIPVLYFLLKVLHAAFARTALANPPESIKSGNYGQPPKTTWWLKQSLIYFIGLVGMKLFVLFLFAVLPWLPWVGDWALRWTEGNEALQIAFVMFLFPVAMNAIQYYIIDSFIKDNGNGSGEGYEQVYGDDDGGDVDGSARRREEGRTSDDSVTEVEEESTRVKSVDDANPRSRSVSARSTPVHETGRSREGEGSLGRRTPQNANDAKEL